MTVVDGACSIRDAAAFAERCGVEPQPASGGQTSKRHRLQAAAGPRSAQSHPHRTANHRAPTRTLPEPEARRTNAEHMYKLAGRRPPHMVAQGDGYGCEGGQR